MKRVASIYRKHWLPITFGPFLKLIEAFFDLMIPLFMKAIIDLNQYGEPSLIPNTISSNLAAFIRTFPALNSKATLSDALVGGFIIIVMGVLGFVITMVAQYIASYTAVRVACDIKDDLYRHILSLSKKDREDISLEKLTTTLNSDTYQIQQGILIFIRLIARAPFIILGSLIFSFILDWRIGLAFTFIVPLILSVTLLVLRQSKKSYVLIQSNLDDISSLTSDSLSGQRVIKASNKAEESESRFDKSTSSYLAKSKALNRINALINPLIFAITSLVSVIILFIIKDNLFAADDSYKILLSSTVVAELAYLAQIFFTTVQLSGVLQDLTKASVARRRVNEVFKKEPSIKDGNETLKDGYKHLLEFKDVSFSYGDNEIYALKDISFTLDKGKTLGIIGGTGSGKSSLISLLARFYQNNKGTIVYKDKRIEDYPLGLLRSDISFVLQKASLLKGSIRDNLSFGLEDIDDEDIIQALKDAEAYEFVSKYEDFFDHEVLENGSNFSGGQKQRLSIARALLRNSDLLILDDSTSALDLTTESRIRNNIAKRNNAKIIISQRVSSIMHADEILLLHNGEIKDRGTHEELLKTSSIYREIFESQLKEKENESK